LSEASLLQLKRVGRHTTAAKTPGIRPRDE
jgi:hypothetical protein